MKKVCIITATRAEYGLLYPLISKIDKDKDLELQLIVSGTHLKKSFGFTRDEILKDGFQIAAEVEILGTGDNPVSTSESMGTAIIRFAEFLKGNKPDIAIILGDRYEMMAFAICLVNEKVPIAHLNGGETTEGSLDEIYRHCITKMSTVHFVNCEIHKRRVIQLGENPARVFNVGDICVENILNGKLLSKEALEKDFNISLEENKIAVVTYHPVTMEENSMEQLENLLQALQEFSNLYFVFTKANADHEGERINTRVQEFTRNYRSAILVDSLGRKRFLSLLKYSTMMIGNSSSGIYEAPIFHIPTVNVGNRQRGRVHGATVIDCKAEVNDIGEAVKLALDEGFQNRCRKCGNLFGDGHTSDKILKEIKGLLQNEITICKTFYDL